MSMIVVLIVMTWMGNQAAGPIATILQIDPSDLSEELRLLVKSYPSR